MSRRILYTLSFPLSHLTHPFFKYLHTPLTSALHACVDDCLVGKSVCMQLLFVRHQDFADSSRIRSRHFLTGQLRNEHKANCVKAHTVHTYMQPSTISSCYKLPLPTSHMGSLYHKFETAIVDSSYFGFIRQYVFSPSERVSYLFLCFIFCRTALRRRRLFLPLGYSGICHSQVITPRQIET